MIGCHDNRHVFTNASRAIRALRLHKGWVQTALGSRAGVSREMVSRIERGELEAITLRHLDMVASALGASVSVQVRWQGEQLDRLIDAVHAQLQQTVAELLIGLGWITRVEVSFNHYGDRGRVDVVAFHPTMRIILIIEIKSVLGDLQETLGRLDVKVRLAHQVARDLGWSGLAAVVPVLVVGDSRRSRAAIATHAALFGRFAVRGRAAVAWLRRPVEPIPTGLLWYSKRLDSHPAIIRRGQRAPKRPRSRPV